MALIKMSKKVAASQKRWLAKRPACIRELYAKLPFNQWYRIDSSYRVDELEEIVNHMKKLNKQLREGGDGIEDKKVSDE